MWPLVILAVVFLAIRLINLTLLPVFADEAIYIHWAQVIWHDATNRFIPLSDGKPPLFMWLMVPFLKVISDPLLAGRLLSVSSGLMTLFGTYLLAKKLFSKKVAILVGVFIVCQPFLFFYDRMALVDSMLTAFGVWSFYLALLLFEKPNLAKGMLLGTIWGGAMLVKPGGAFFPLLTPFFILLTPFKKWQKKIKKLIIPSLLASGYGLGFYNVLRLSGAFHMIRSRSADYIRDKADLLANPFQFIPDTGKAMFTWLISYFSWFGIVWLIVGLILALVKKEKKIGLLFLWTAFPFLVPAAIGKIIYARYLLIIVPFWLIISSWAVWQAVSVIKKRWWRMAVWLLLGLTIGTWLSFTRWLIIDPTKAPFHHGEKEQYLHEWAAGYGIKEVADYLKLLPRDKEIEVATEGYFGTLPNGLQIYMDQVEGFAINGVGQPIDYLPDEVREAITEGKEVYLVVNSTRLKIEDQSKLELIGEYPKPEGPKGQEKLLFFKVKP